MSKLTTIKLLFIILIPFNSASQDSMVVVSTSNYNVVYRDVPNLIKIGFDRMTEPYYISCRGCRISDMDTLGNYLPRHQFLITPGPPRLVFVDLWTNSDTNNRVKLATLEFINRNLPDPAVYIGGVKEEGQIGSEESWIFVKYPPEVLLDNRFKLLNWTVKIKRKRYSGIGSHLTPQVLERIQKMKYRSIMEIQVETIGEDNRTRTLETFFYRAKDNWKDMSE